MKTLIPFLLALVLTACGGGGGGGGGSSAPTHSDTQVTYSDVSLSFVPRLAYANFGGAYVVMSGVYMGPNSTGPANPDAPLKVFKLTATGFEDATAQILGTNTTAPGNAIIADFNGDGTDDIFTGYLKDYPSADSQGNAHTGNGVVFLSHAGSTHTRTTLPGLSWTHQATAADVDSDGDIDIVTSQGIMWLNDGAGNFTFKNHSFNTSAYWMNGSGVCVGDFTNSGRNQLVMTDLMTDAQLGPIADTVIFDLDSTAEPTAMYTLPTPTLDVGNTGAEKSHDVGCTVMDINHDGLKDIVVFSRAWEWVHGTWDNVGKIQVLLNQGNYQFVDATNTVTLDANAAPAYSYIVKDFNNDGVMDLWTSNQLLMGSNNSLTHKTLPAINADAMLPVAVQGGYKIMYVKDGIGQYTVNLTGTVVSF